MGPRPREVLASGPTPPGAARAGSRPPGPPTDERPVPRRPANFDARGSATTAGTGSRPHRRRSPRCWNDSFRRITRLPPFTTVATARESHRHRHGQRRRRRRPSSTTTSTTCSGFQPRRRRCSSNHPEEATWVALTDVSEAHTDGPVARNHELNRFVGSTRSSRRSGGRSTTRPSSTTRRSGSSRRSGSAPPRRPGRPRGRQARDRAEAKQSARRTASFSASTPGEPEIPLGQRLDRVLVESRDLDERRDVWETSKDDRRPAPRGPARFRDLRNKVAQAWASTSFFALQVADYGMTVPEMLALSDGFLAEIKPLYLQLHTWAKHPRRAYKAEVPATADPRPLAPNRWGQDWPGLVEGIDMDGPSRARRRSSSPSRPSGSTSRSGSRGCRNRSTKSPTSTPADPKSGRKKNSHASPGISTSTTTSAA